MSLDTKISLRLIATLTKAADLISAGLSAPLNISESFNLTDGVALGNADLLMFDTISLSGTTPNNLDFAPFTDIFGVSKTFVKIKALYLAARAANTQAIIVGNHATTPFIGPFGADGSSEHYLRAGAYYLALDPVGWTVTPTTGDILALTGAGAGTHVLDIVAVGTSA